VKETQALLRGLPSIDRLLANPRMTSWLARLDRGYVTRCCRDALEELRAGISRGGDVTASAIEEDAILKSIEHRIHRDSQASLERVVNATGTILHTNLGRAICRRLPSTLYPGCWSACQPEYDLERGAPRQARNADRTASSG
jgi:L-seryl-tRNA(Ser) seleniumtransferase